MCLYTLIMSAWNNIHTSCGYIHAYVLAVGVSNSQGHHCTNGEAGLANSYVKYVGMEQVVSESIHCKHSYCRSNANSLYIRTLQCVGLSTHSVQENPFTSPLSGLNTSALLVAECSVVGTNLVTKCSTEVHRVSVN